MAFFPANATYPSMLGELYSAAFTAPAFNWLCSPAVTELETIVLDWLARILHLPDCFLSEGEGGGVMQGSASEAVVTVMVAARERYLNTASEGLSGKEKEDKIAHTRSRLIALSTEESHSSVAKAALIAGVLIHSHIGFESIVIDYVPTHRMPGVRRFLMWALKAAFVVVGYGYYEFETNDVGLSEGIRRMWKA